MFLPESLPAHVARYLDSLNMVALDVRFYVAAEAFLPADFASVRSDHPIFSVVDLVFAFHHHCLHCCLQLLGIPGKHPIWGEAVFRRQNIRLGIM